MNSPNGSGSIQDAIIDETMIIVGLMLLQEMLFMSNYPDEVKKELVERSTKLIERIQKNRNSGYDAYGNPYQGSGG